MHTRDAGTLSSTTPLYPADEELVRRALLGEEESFRALMNRYQRSIYRLCYFWTGNRDDALDLCQECFVHLYKVMGRYNSQFRFHVWLYKVCTNRCINWLKANRRARETVPFSHLTEQALDMPDLGPGPAEAAFQSEVRQVLIEAVEKLPDKYRVPITLRYLEELSYKEIAAIMDITVKNVEIRIHRAKKMLHEQLKTRLNPEG